MCSRASELDDDDINREIRNMFMRTNVLLRGFQTVLCR